MPPPVVAARQPTFKARIAYKNVDMLPAELRKGVAVPQGVEAHAPIYSTLAGIVGVQQDRSKRYNYQRAGDLSHFAVGYTDADLSVSFTDFTAAWRCEQDFWRFCGGEIVFACTIGVYVDERAKPAEKRRCLEMIMTHELLHVRDEIDIVTNWLPNAALNDSMIKANLSADARIPANHFAAWIRGNGDGRGSDLERRIQREIYIAESSDRAATLHRSRPQDSKAILDCLNA